MTALCQELGWLWHAFHSLVSCWAPELRLLEGTNCQMIRAEKQHRTWPGGNPFNSQLQALATAKKALQRMVLEAKVHSNHCVCHELRVPDMAVHSVETITLLSFLG